jgi:hypothetical protein
MPAVPACLCLLFRPAYACCSVLPMPAVPSWLCPQFRPAYACCSVLHQQRCKEKKECVSVRTGLRRAHMYEFADSIIYLSKKLAKIYQYAYLFMDLF